MGDPFEVFNGEGGFYLASVIGIEKKCALIKLEKFFPTESESPLKIHLGQAIAKGERMDYAIQKAVELGVFAITPLITQHGQMVLKKEVFAHRVLHWQHVAISAAEQSKRAYVPKVHSVQTFADFVAQANGLKLICALEKKIQPLSVNDTVEKISLLIGPEGGFSPQELSQAQQNNFLTINLGPRILRTETAAVTAISLLQQKWGDIPL